MTTKNATEKRFVFTSKNVEEIIAKQNDGVRLPRYMNPWFMNNIGVRKENVVFGWTKHEITEFAKCAASIHYFSNNYCHIKSEDGQVRQMTLRDYQYDILSAYTKNRFTLNMSSRQIGKCANLISDVDVMIDNKEMKIPMFKLLFKYKKNKTIYDYIKYPIYWILWKLKKTTLNKSEKILFKLINKIEDYQYRSVDLDEDNIYKKITNITFVEDEEIYVDSPEGLVKVTEINETQPYNIYKVSTENNKSIYCADNHMLYADDGLEKELIDFNEGDKIITRDGLEKIVSIEDYGISNAMIDLTVDSLAMRYYVDDILSHNTITAAIMILHYCIFNSNKGVMIVANKADTVVEILDKIKDIYKLLPFFLKPGVVNWNKKDIVFDNGCRIKSQARSKEPAIGFTIDLLYMDEFAHIPRNIITHYYRAAVPTVSSIKGSKIIITSTPNGNNLFKDLVMGAKLPPGHPEKNMYNLITVYWHQVPDGEFKLDNGEIIRGTRLDPKLFLKHEQIEKYGFTPESLLELFKDFGFICTIDTENSAQGKKQYIRILYEDGKSDIDIIRRIKIDDIDIVKLFIITNWKEEETKLIGGEDNFNQEYNIQFVAGSKRVMSSEKTTELSKRAIKYKPVMFPEIDDLHHDVESLRFHPDFDLTELGKYYWVTACDMGEGLGLDDSVINGFRLMVRDEEFFERNTIKNLHEAFYLKQTFILNENHLGNKTAFPELYYTLHFKVLDPMKTKAVLELNGPADGLMGALPGVFDGYNEFGKYIFAKFKQKEDDKYTKAGYKVSRNKKSLVKLYIDGVENDSVYVDEDETIEQMGSFIKVETPSGDYTYKADGGHDDIVMSNVGIANYMQTHDFKNLCSMYYNELTSVQKKMIDDALQNNYAKNTGASPSNTRPNIRRGLNMHTNRRLRR